MKYIIDIPDEVLEFMNGKFNFFIEPEVKVGECRHYKVRLDDTEVTPYTEPDQKAIDLQHAHDIENVARMNYSKGAEDAWELARLISLQVYDGGLNRTDLNECYKSVSIQEVMKNYSYQEAKAKYDTWRAERDEIRVGDEVKENIGLWTGVVVGFDEVDDLIIMDRSGKSCDGYKTRFFRKTGRHFDEVEALLKKMGDEK